MTTWTSEELDAIDAADELEIVSIGHDGALREPTGVTSDVTFVDADEDLVDGSMTRTAVSTVGTPSSIVG